MRRHRHAVMDFASFPVLELLAERIEREMALIQGIATLVIVTGIDHVLLN